MSASPAKELASFIAKFDPAIARLVRAARSALRKRLPTAIEQVYDNYNFLAIGYSTTERTSDCIVSLAVSAKGVALSFYHGASLPDPDKLLVGSGNQNRFLRLTQRRDFGPTSGGIAPSRGDCTSEDPTAQDRSRLHDD